MRDPRTTWDPTSSRTGRPWYVVPCREYLRPIKSVNMVPIRCMVKSAMAVLPILKIIWRIKITLTPTQCQHKMTHIDDVTITWPWRHHDKILTPFKQSCNLWICFICTIYSDNMDIKYLIKLFHESFLLSKINESYQCVYKQYWPLYWLTHTDWFEHLSAWQ